MFRPLPLMSNKQLAQFYPFRLKERYLDMAEMYTLYKTKDISTLYPDSCTKLATFFYKDTEVGDSIFKMLAKHLYDRYHVRMYIITIHEKTNTTDMVYTCTRYHAEHETFEKHTGKTLSDNTYILLEYDQGDFGHYCGAVYTNRRFELFDSMMYYQDSVQCGYLDTWKKSIQAIFHVPKGTRFYKDYYYVPGGSMMDYFSCEITGGAIEIENNYAALQTNQSESFACDVIFMGVDNQNQYCWMWTVFYMLSKAVGDKYDWKLFHRKIQEKDIIPVVFIKLFTSLIVLMNRTPVLSSSRFFKKYFNTVLTNYPTYRGTFNNSHRHFTLMSCEIGEMILDGQFERPVSLSDCVRMMYTIVLNDECVVSGTVMPGHSPFIANIQHFIEQDEDFTRLYEYANSRQNIENYKTFFSELIEYYTTTEVRVT